MQIQWTPSNFVYWRESVCNGYLEVFLEKQKSSFVCKFCGVVLTRRHDLTRQQVPVKCKDVQTQSTSLQIQPGEEELAPAEQSASVQIQPGEEEVAPAEQSTPVQIQPGEEELAPAEQSTLVQIQPGEEELAPAEQSTLVQIQPGEEELGITSFTAIAPEGVEIVSTQFYQFISSAVEDATNDFDVSSQEVAEMRDRQIKPAVVRNGTNLLPGLEIPQDELSFRQVLDGFPLTRKINVCFSSLQEVEDDFDLMDLLTHNENQTLQADYHPMNVIDLDIEGHLNNMSHKFSLRSRYFLWTSHEGCFAHFASTSIWFHSGNQ